MSKKFDAVEFQRKRRTELSKKLSGMTPEEIVGYFKSKSKIYKKSKTGYHKITM